jgi:hypothetical protein
MPKPLNSGLRFITADGRPDRRAARAWVRRQVERAPSMIAMAPDWYRYEFDTWSAKRWAFEYIKEWRELARGELSIWQVRAGVGLSPVPAETARQLSTDGPLPPRDGERAARFDAACASGGVA